MGVGVPYTCTERPFLCSASGGCGRGHHLKTPLFCPQEKKYKSLNGINLQKFESDFFVFPRL